MTRQKYETWDDQCPDCGRTNRMCICDPRDGFFESYEEKRRYQMTHPDSRGWVRVIPMTVKEQAIVNLRVVFPNKSDEELVVIWEKFKSPD